jgi:DNA-binding PadR family transcriptional regulator
MSQLLNPAKRQERIKEKRSLILKFLRYETFTHVDVVKELMNVSTIQSAYQTLNKMVRDNLITKAEINISYGRPITLFGISPNGLAHAFDLGDNYEIRPTFQPSKVKPSTLQHKIQVQMFIVKSTKLGYTNTKNADLLKLRGNEIKVPDLIANFDEKIIALEVELTFKSIKRYSQIITSHLLSIKNGSWNEVHYLVPSQDFKSRLERLFKSIKSVEYKGQKIHLNEKHFNKFKFYIIENSK